MHFKSTFTIKISFVLLDIKQFKKRIFILDIVEKNKVKKVQSKKGQGKKDKVKRTR